MATLASTRPTILDVTRSLDPDGKIAKVAEVISQYNDILDDIPWKEGNLATGNLTTIRTSYASPSLRALNAGITETKSTNGQINDACSILENRNAVDCNLAQMSGNVEAYRFDQDKGMMAGFGISLAEHLIYGSSADNPLEFNGLATRYFTLGSTWTTSSQVIDAGGVGSDNTSIWLANWGDGCHGVYPKGSQGGLQVKNLGEMDYITNGTTLAKMRAYVTWMQWMVGLAIPDYRNVVRIANIDVSNLATAGDSSDTSAHIMKYMSLALDLLPPDASGRPVFYMTRNTRGLLRTKMQDKSNLFLKVEETTAPTGITRRPGLTFQGVPCRVIDQMLSTESRVLAAS